MSLKRERKRKRSRSESPYFPKRKGDCENVRCKTDSGQEIDQHETKVHARKIPPCLEELIARKIKENELMRPPMYIRKGDRTTEAIKRHEEVDSKLKALQKLEGKRNDGNVKKPLHSERVTYHQSKGPPPEQLENILGKDCRNERETHMNSSEAIKERYLGVMKNKKRVQRRSGNKFLFDWDASEDTWEDYNQYKERHHIQLFGRGHIAGIDPIQQKEGHSTFYRDLLRKQQTDAEKKHIEGQQANVTWKAGKRQWDDRHWSEKALAEMTIRDWRIFREDHDIICKGGNIPNPLKSWEESTLSDDIKGVIDEIGYKEPTPIQRQAIPIGLENRDIIGVAETGSGKTAAFLLPLIAWIQSLPNLIRVEDADQGPFALILAPTRELAQQIERENVKFGQALGIRTLAIISGVPREEQAFKMQQGCEIVVATPGRLIDLLEHRYIVLCRCTYVIMDEADRMIDMGFEPDIQKILQFLPVTNENPDTTEAEVQGERRGEYFQVGHTYRQTVMFTATMPPEVERLAQSYLHNPAEVYVGSDGKPHKRVEQIIYMLSESEKRKKLLKILEAGITPPVLIFVNQKKGAEVLARSLEKLGYNATSLHGDKGKGQREQSLNSLKDGLSDIMVATDLAGRGIDIKDVSLVINYDMSRDIKAYIHRIGRTGRAGKKGVAITFLTKEDVNVFFDLKEAIMESPVSKCPRELQNHPDAQHRPFSRGQKKSTDEKRLTNY